MSRYWQDDEKMSEEDCCLDSAKGSSDYYYDDDRTERNAKVTRTLQIKKGMSDKG